MVPVAERLLPYISGSEINFLAFGLPTEEYHNELFEELKYKYDSGKKGGIKPFDIGYLQKVKGELPEFPFMENDKQVSEHTHIRNQIHHSKTLGRPSPDRLTYSIKKLRKYLEG